MTIYAMPIIQMYACTISSEAEVQHGVCMPVEGGHHGFVAFPGKVIPAKADQRGENNQIGRGLST